MCACRLVDAECMEEQQQGIAAAAAYENAPIQSALQLVFSQLCERDLLCSIPLVCRSWHEAASVAYSNRPMISTSFQVYGAAKTVSLAAWLQRHGCHLLHLGLVGFRRGVTGEWWAGVLSAPLNKLQHLSLRSCGVPDVPIHLLQNSAPSLRSLKLEHAPCAPAAEAIASMTQLTSLVMRRCQLSTEHLNAVGRLSSLVVLGLPGNNLVCIQEQSRHACSTASDSVSSSSGSTSCNSDTNSSSGADGLSDTALHGVGSPQQPKQQQDLAEQHCLDGVSQKAGGTSSSGCSNHSQTAQPGVSTGSCSGSSEGPSNTGTDTLPSPPEIQQQGSADQDIRSHQPVSSWVTGLQHLQELDLSNCKLQASLLDQLPAVTALTKLNLSRRSLDAKPGTAEATAAIYGVTTQLRWLVMAANDAVHSPHVLTIGAVMGATCAVLGRLRQLLDLDVSYIPNACEQLCAGARSAGGPLALLKVNLSYTGCTEEQMEQLMACSPYLKHIDAGGNEALCSVGGCYI